MRFEFSDFPIIVNFTTNVSQNKAQLIFDNPVVDGMGLLYLFLYHSFSLV
jgi:hypothetical protein